MENIVLNITIGERNKSEKFLDFYKKQNVSLSLGTYGKGTASKETLDMLGIGSSEKCVIFSLMTMDDGSNILKKIEKEFKNRVENIIIGLNDKNKKKYDGLIKK